ncbi:MAG: hypothetical protein E7391_04195 [Ruminococcaceae bacterium]|nr:hypothetical protein [Oscillospiraceae bacterium]
MIKFNEEFKKDFHILSKTELMQKYDISNYIYDKWRSECKLHKVSYNRNKRKFTPEEEKFIKDNWFKMQDAEIAKALGRSRHVISTKRARMGLYKNYTQNIFSDKEYNMIIWWLTGDTFDTIRLLYSCSNEDIENALKQTDKMKLAMKRIKKYGCFPIVRKRHEILKYNKDLK